MTSPAAGAPRTAWSLECVSGEHRGWEVALRPGTFRVGRLTGLDLILHSSSISKLHAELHQEEEGDLSVKDLESRNGTFVNGERITESPLVHGDVVRFAEIEFRVVAGSAGKGSALPSSTGPLSVHLPPVQELEGVRALVRDASVTVIFQPIYDLGSGRRVGVEALGRGTCAGLPSLPSPLFELAGWVGLQAELSRVLRRRAVEEVAGRPELGPLFLNTHPTESDREALLASVAELRGSPARLVLELHERTLSEEIGGLKSALASLGVQLAFDDFGAGQARLMELADTPPDYLKFDMSFIRNVDQAAPARQRLLRSMVQLAHELGTHTVAEGVETPAELAAVRELGFRSAQGYYFGRPVPVGEL